MATTEIKNEATQTAETQSRISPKMTIDLLKNGNVAFVSAGYAHGKIIRHHSIEDTGLIERYNLGLDPRLGTRFKCKPP